MSKRLWSAAFVAIVITSSAALALDASLPPTGQRRRFPAK